MQKMSEPAPAPALRFTPNHATDLLLSFGGMLPDEIFNDNKDFIACLQVIAENALPKIQEKKMAKHKSKLDKKTKNTLKKIIKQIDKFFNDDLSTTERSFASLIRFVMAMQLLSYLLLNSPVSDFVSKIVKKLKTTFNTAIKGVFSKFADGFPAEFLPQVDILEAMLINKPNENVANHPTFQYIAGFFLQEMVVEELDLTGCAIERLNSQEFSLLCMAISFLAPKTLKLNGNRLDQLDVSRSEQLRDCISPALCHLEIANCGFNPIFINAFSSLERFPSLLSLNLAGLDFGPALNLPVLYLLLSLSQRVEKNHDTRITPVSLNLSGCFISSKPGDIKRYFAALRMATDLVLYNCNFNTMSDEVFVAICEGLASTRLEKIDLNDDISNHDREVKFLAALEELQANSAIYKLHFAFIRLKNAITHVEHTENTYSISEIESAFTRMFGLLENVYQTLPLLVKHGFLESVKPLLDDMTAFLNTIRDTPHFFRVKFLVFGVRCFYLLNRKVEEGRQTVSVAKAFTGILRDFFDINDLNTFFADTTKEMRGCHQVFERCLKLAASDVPPNTDLIIPSVKILGEVLLLALAEENLEVDAAFYLEFFRSIDRLYPHAVPKNNFAARFDLAFFKLIFSFIKNESVESFKTIGFEMLDLINKFISDEYYGRVYIGLIFLEKIMRARQIGIYYALLEIFFRVVPIDRNNSLVFLEHHKQYFNQLIAFFAQCILPEDVFSKLSAISKDNPAKQTMMFLQSIFLKLQILSQTKEKLANRTDLPGSSPQAFFAVSNNNSVSNEIKKYISETDECLTKMLNNNDTGMVFELLDNCLVTLDDRLQNLTEDSTDRFLGGIRQVLLIHKKLSTMLGVEKSAAAMEMSLIATSGSARC